MNEKDQIIIRPTICHLYDVRLRIWLTAVRFVGSYMDTNKNNDNAYALRLSIAL